MSRCVFILSCFFSLALAGESCSLELRPARVVVAFGGSVTVNCVAARPVRVLGWESAVGATHTQNDLTVQWKVDSLIDWIEEPICYGVFFSAPKQCEERLNLVLYKTPDSVSIRLNHTGSMLEGKEYQLVCEVQNIAPVQYLTLRWYRGQTEVYNHSFSDLTPTTPVQVSSSLLITPSIADQGVEYRCAAELDLGLDGPRPPPRITSNPLDISVHFAPVLASPDDETLELSRGEHASLNCTAMGNPPPSYTWSSAPMLALPLNLDKMDDQPVLTSTSLRPGLYTCTASNILGKTSKNFTIKPRA